MPKTYSVMLTWDDQGASLVMALIPATAAEIKILKRAHGQYINGSDTTDEQAHALDYVNSALADPSSECYYTEDDLKAAHGTWHKHMIDLKKPFALAGSALVVFCGFAP